MSERRVRYIVGVDLGGTNIVVGAMPEDGSRQLAVRQDSTHAELGADAVVDRIASMVADVIAEVTTSEKARAEDFLGVGVGAPGPLDRERGVVVVAPNLGWRDFPLRDSIATRTGLPVALDNDANCATMGEWWKGAAQGAKNVVGITIGTGIGGGIIMNGVLYHGSSDVAGEIGHTTIDSTGRYCRCGNYGCLEAYASGPAIALRAREALERDEVSMLRRMVDGHLDELTAATIYAAANAGDALALEVVRDTARFLGTGIGNLLNILNPDVVVITGGVTQAGEPLFEPLRAEVKRRAFRPAVDACRIVAGTLRSGAGMVGAVATFKQQRLGAV
ncbi:MAG: ROK family glucokinase [Gemmatimonadota bacterium]|nr:ROK family glucokinase [Gemmatimonadota bacterium]